MRIDRYLDRWSSFSRLALLFGCMALSASQVTAAQEEFSSNFFPRASHVLLPQVGSYALTSEHGNMRVDWMEARVEILELSARTTLRVSVTNPGASQAEAVVMLPVPSGAAVSNFAFSGEGPSSGGAGAKLLPREEARRTYDEIVSRVKDPALLEFVGSQLIRSSVFPVEPGHNRIIQLTYEHILEVDGDRRDYYLPRSESLGARIPCRIEIELRSKKPISMAYSPSHGLEVLEHDSHHQILRLSPEATTTPGPFRLCYLVAEEGVSASLIACPDEKAGGGYFLLMAGLPGLPESRAEPIKREVTLVIDRSGSMAGEKMDQVRAAALEVIERLEPGEAYNIIDYSNRVSMFAPAPVVKGSGEILAARKYLASLRPGGGTNINDAIGAALSQDPSPGFLGLVLFLTDGLPTVGKTLEYQINGTVTATNAHSRRIFTFGVGNDVNVPLLDRISDQTRALSTYVLPGEDVEAKVVRVFGRLRGPLLSDLELETLDASGAISTRSTRDVLPERLPDLYEGDQLVVLGRYLGAEPLRFRLSGMHLGTPRSFRFDLPVSKADVGHTFVPRLWAARRITLLVDLIRQAGASTGALPLAGGASLFQDPRYAELAEEILRLSTEFGILSEYTSFLALEGTDLKQWGSLLLACNEELERRAVRTRSGGGAVSQGRNFNDRKLQKCLNLENAFWNEDNVRVESMGVQQISDRAFFLCDGQWVDSRLIQSKEQFVPQETVLFGSEVHHTMVSALAAQGRQGLLSLPGEILLEYGGKTVLVVNGGKQ
jgi:Ca-activated chloride channel homolog